MDNTVIAPAQRLCGEVVPPPDKSISHRAVMFSALANGTSIVRNVLRAQDTESTMRAFRMLGVRIHDDGNAVVVQGAGRSGLQEPSDVVDCGNSGTTIRLLTGVLSGTAFFSVLTGDESLRSRPMARVVTPLSSMGAEIRGRDNDRLPPLAIRGRKLQPIEYAMPIASAQVKSSILLAGLSCDGTTVVTEPERSRDHTERMLPAFGADLAVDGLSVRLRGGRELTPSDTDVPADFSSAAFFLVAALLVPESEVMIRNVGLNPTRTGLLRVLERMGAAVEISNRREVSGEPVGDLFCRHSGRLRAASVGSEEVPSMIDEFPILCVAAAQADGTTEIRGAAELRVKESDRIRAMATELRKTGIALEEFDDGVAIEGAERLRGAVVDSHGDHRIAMSMAVAGLVAKEEITIRNASAVAISFPTFFGLLEGLKA